MVLIQLKNERYWDLFEAKVMLPGTSWSLSGNFTSPGWNQTLSQLCPQTRNEPLNPIWGVERDKRRQKWNEYQSHWNTFTSLQRIFSLSLSYVWPGTRFDLTTSHAARLVGQKWEENKMFRCYKITLEVSLQLFNEDHATSIWILLGLLRKIYFCLPSVKNRPYSHFHVTLKCSMEVRLVRAILFTFKLFPWASIAC